MTVTFRNIGVLAHVDAGKTTLTERMLFNSGRIHRTGEVHDGTTTTDFKAAEIKHGITISAAAATCDWNGATINIVDTPGHVDFTLEVERSMLMLDSAIAVFSAVAGVEPQSETVWRQADRFDVPRIIFINKMDMAGADIDRVLAMTRGRLGALPLQLQLPLGEGPDHYGVVDLLERQALVWSAGETTPQVQPVPAAHVEKMEQMRQALVERLVETDDESLARWLEDPASVDATTLRRLVRQGVLARQWQPVLCGSAKANIGVQPLLDAIVAYAPAPDERALLHGVDPQTGQALTRRSSVDEPALVIVAKVTASRFGALAYVRVLSGQLRRGMVLANTTTGKPERVGRLLRLHANETEEVEVAEAGAVLAIAGLKGVGAGHTLCDPAHLMRLDGLDPPAPVVQATLEPATAADRERLGAALAAMTREDPSLVLGIDEETGQTLLSGMGELHLAIAVEELETEHNVRARLGRPHVAYREALGRPSQVEVVHRKQNGGVGEYAKLSIALEPRPFDETGLQFEDRTVGGAIPKAFVPAIETALREALGEGTLAGYPVLGLKATLLDGAWHATDSSAQAFALAARQAFRLGFAQGEPLLLEPVMQVEVAAPGETLGAIIGDLQSRRASILATDMAGATHVVTALAPLANLFSYADRVRSLSQGRASFAMKQHGYEPVPKAQAAVIVETRIG